MALSRRVQAFAGPVLEWEILGNLWGPTNPSGYVNLGIAENHLLHKELAEYLHQKVDFSNATLTYGDGSKKLRDTMARFLSEHLKSAAPIVAAHIIVTNGIGPAIEHLGWALADPGDSFLVGRPFYDGFSELLSIRPKARIVPVSFRGTDPLGLDCVRHYEEKIVEIQQRGGRVAGIVICHPNNPLGRCYPREVLIELMKLCQNHRIHLVSDEAYAFSIFSNNVDTASSQTFFHSVLSIDTTGIIDPELIQMLWGMSKDFGASGFRLGAIITQNVALYTALGKLALLSIPSSLTEYATSQILDDDAWVRSYISKNSTKLGQLYEHVTTWATEQGLEYAPGANAAFFLWVDLGSAYRKSHPNTKNIDGEIADALHQHRVYLASDFGSEQSGWFRIAFAVPRVDLDEGLARIVSAIRGMAMRF